MSFDLDKLQAVAELGEVIRLQNEALERLQAFRKARPHMMMPNLAKMVEENIKDNVMVLYKELNNLHKPAEKQTRYVCSECKMAFLSPLPGGLCDECRARKSGGGPRQYVPYQGPSGDEEDDAAVAKQAAEAEAEAESDESDAKPAGDTAAKPGKPKTDRTSEASAKPAATGAIEDLYAAAIAEEAAANAEEPAAETPNEDGYTPDEAPAEETTAEEATAEVNQTEPDLEPDEEPVKPVEEQKAKAPKKSPGASASTGSDDFFDTPGDKVELANPAPEVAKPEGVEGVPDIDDDAGAGDRDR